jgi:hypothetical protein
MLLKTVMAAAVGSLLICNAAFSQTLPPPAKKAAHVEIKQGPALELVRGDLAIIRFTTNNPGGTDDHSGSTKATRTRCSVCAWTA